MINGIITVGANIFFDIILMQVFGLGGLALATSLSSIICILLLFRGLKKKMGYYGQDRIFKTFIKSLVASIVMGVATYFMYKLSSTILGAGFIQDVIATGMSVLVGAVVYGILISRFKVREVKMLKNMVMKKLKRA
jgi:putative peptidoglycan lipid II flippase